MTAVMERRSADYADRHTHVHIDKFSAIDERATAFMLFPTQARELEKLGLIWKGRHGGLERDDAKMSLVAPHLAIPRITREMMVAVGADITGTVDWEGNLLCNAGINRFGGLSFGAGTGQIYNTANSSIGAGDTNTAAAATQTDLSAAVNAANRYINLVDSQPTFSTQVLTMVATFATGNGNFAWAEWIVSQNTSSGAVAATAAVLNRKVASLGTKTSAAAWAFTITITFS